MNVFIKENDENEILIEKIFIYLVLNSVYSVSILFYTNSVLIEMVVYFSI